MIIKAQTLALARPASNSGLPQTWAVVKLPAIATIIMGQSPPGATYNTEGNGLPFFQGKADFGERYPTTRVWCSQPRKVAQPGDIILSVRAPVGPSNIVNQKCAIGRGLAIIRLSQGMSPEFLWFWLRFREHALASLGTGSTFTAISRRHLDDLDVPVPSRSEQQRIVARIEELLAHVKNARDRLARVKAIMKRFRQAVLTAAVSGRLTADWRGTNVENNTESGLPESWELLSLGTLADSIRGGSTEVPTRDKTSYPILRSSSVRPFAIDYADVRHLRAEQSERDENFVKDGDLLITRLSGSIDYVGNCALVRSLNGRRIQYPDRLFCCRLRDPAEAPFVELFFAGPSMRRQIEDASRSAAGHQRISISDLQGFTIARPPIDEQREVVRRVEALFALADNIERRLDATAASAETLTQAILAKAFRGELVDSAQRPAFNDRPVDTDPRSDVRSVPRARERP